MGRRILVVNPNSVPAVTARVGEWAARYAAVDTELTCLNPEAGPEGVDALLDQAVSGIETVQLIARHRAAFDAFVIAGAGDPGLEPSRQVTDRPVVGITEASLLFAMPLGARFALVTTSPGEIPFLEELVRHHGIADRLASVRAVDVSTRELLDDMDGLYGALLSTSRAAVLDDRGEVLVLVGSVLCEFVDGLTRELGVPVVSGTFCGVKLAEALVDLGLRTSPVGKYANPVKRDALIGYPDLQSVYGAGPVRSDARAAATRSTRDE